MWIDHCEVSEFHLGREDVVALKLNLNCSTRHIHHKSNNIGCVHEALVAEFLNAAAQFIASAGAFLITDRANSKTQSKLYIKKHRYKLMKVKLSVETIDHSSDAQLMACAHK